MQRVALGAPDAQAAARRTRCRITEVGHHIARTDLIAHADQADPGAGRGPAVVMVNTAPR
jgi:hypothetical protein